jgi:capsular polysaccharide biosynthesis protein
VRQQNYRAVELAGTAQLDTLSERLQSADDAIARDQTTLHRLDSQTAEADLAAQTRAARLARADDARRRTQQAAARVDAIWQEVGSTRALSEASPPAEPDFPAPSLLVEGACAVGLAAGLLSALLAERGRRTIDRPDDIVRHLKIEVLARLHDVPMAQLR